MGRGSVATLLLATTLVFCASITVAPALALAPGYGQGRSYCEQYGNAPSSHAFDGVYACATTSSWGPTPFDSAGRQSFQCVELSARFLWAIYGIWAGPGTGVQDGADLVAVVHAQHPRIRVGFPAPGAVPVAGDVVSLGPGGAVDGRFGHTAVVVSDDEGAGRFTIIGQNFPPGRAGEQTLRVDFRGRHDGRALIDGVWTTASWLELRPQPPPIPDAPLPGHRHAGGW
jgi:hypothetical protein